MSQTNNLKKTVVYFETESVKLDVAFINGCMRVITSMLPFMFMDDSIAEGHFKASS